jgi:hypothetical protein
MSGYERLPGVQGGAARIQGDPAFRRFLGHAEDAEFKKDFCNTLLVTEESNSFKMTRKSKNFCHGLTRIVTD